MIDQQRLHEARIVEIDRSQVVTLKRNNLTSPIISFKNKDQQNQIFYLWFGEMDQLPKRKLVVNSKSA